MNIKDVKLVKGMSRDEINNLISEWLIFLDEEYLGSKYKHNWKCKCGRSFTRDWGKIRLRESKKCEDCVYEYRKPIAIENHKDKVKNTNYEYIKSYFKGDILENGDKIIKKSFIRIKCRECNTEFDIRSDRFKDDISICPYCNPHLRNFKNTKDVQYCKPIIPKKEESLGVLYPHIADMIVENENGDKVKKEDSYKIHSHSNKKYKFKCNKCGKIGDLRSLNQIVQHGYSCHYCSDNKSIPNKFMVELLKIINVDFKSEKTFDWSDRKQYDFYIPSLKMIIEMNGIQHYEECNLTKRSLKEEQENDKYKKELAINNGIENYIVIDCRYSTFNWIKENIIKELNEIFNNLDNINWDEVWLNCQNSLVIKTWELYNQGVSTKEIAKELNIGKTTVSRYLHKGNEIGKCNFGKRKKMM